MRPSLYRFDHELRSRLQDYQDTKIKSLSRRDLVQELLIHASVLAVATYSAYEGWDASLLYAKSKDNLLNTLGPYMSFCTVSINTFQAADIYLGELQEFRRDVSDNEKQLLSTMTLAQQIKKRSVSMACIILGTASAIPLSYIMYKDTHNLLLTILTFLTNVPISYRGVYNLRMRIPTHLLLRDKKQLLLVRAQKALAEHILQSYDNLLQKPQLSIEAKLESLHKINLYTRVDVITPLLNLDVAESAAMLPSTSKWRLLFTTLSVIFVVCPQFGYMLDAWKAGAVIDDKNSSASIIFLILNVIVYVGLSLDAALELSSIFFNGRKTAFAHLNSIIMRITSTLMLFISLGSGAMLADTNMSNELDDYSDDATPVVYFPAGLAHLFEISSFVSEGFTNYYYAIHYVIILCNLYYRSHSSNTYKQGLVKLNDTVSHMVSLILNMGSKKFKKVITHDSFPQERLKGIFTSVFTPSDINRIFEIGEQECDEDSYLLENI